MSSARHTRVAVAQLDYLPAIVIDRRSPLSDPTFALGQPDGLAPASGQVPQALRGPLKELRERVRAGYVEQLGAKLRAIVASCRAWDVRVLVLPEYCVPWELLPQLAEAAGDMVVVAGTHSVERAGKKAGVYKDLGWLRDPTTNSAVAPVLHKGQLMSLQPKLSAAKPERRGLVTGTTWSPVEFDPITGPQIAGPMGVLICLDFLWRERDEHRERVAPGLEQTRFLAVPSYTPAFTIDEFGAKGWEEARRYGRPVLYANHASGGGTSLFVDEGKPFELSRFPERVGQLQAGEEGVIVADVDLGYVRSGGSTRYGGVAVAKPVAMASLVYRMHPIADRYADWSLAMAQRLGDEGSSVDDAIDHVEESKELLIEASALLDGKPRQRRIGRLLTEIDGVGKREELLQFTREVVLPEEVLPLGVVKQALALGAAEVVLDWLADHRGIGFEAVEQRLREVGRGLLERDRAESTEAAMKVCGVVQRRAQGESDVAGGRRKADAAVEVRPAFPAGARLGRFDKEVDGWTLMFRERPQGLAEVERGLNEPEEFVDRKGRRKEKRPRMMHANFAPRQIELATDLWLSLRARGAEEVSVVGVVSGESDSAVVVLHCEGGTRVATAVGWGIGSAWTRKNEEAITRALDRELYRFEGLRWWTQRECEEQRWKLRGRLVAGAKVRIDEAVALRVGDRGFVEPRVEVEGNEGAGFAVLDTWLGQPHELVAMVLGSFGMGKSTLLAMWAQRKLAEDGSLVPVLVDLARATATEPIGLVCEAAGFDHAREAERAAMTFLLRSRDVFVCFDGFDEMITRRSFSDLSRELQALFSMARLARRVVVSSRDHYFSHEGEAVDAVDRAMEGAGLSGVRRIVLRDFGADEVAKLVHQVVEDPAAQQAVLRKIEDTYDLTDLVRTPLLLRMVLETIDQIDPSATVGSATIYDEYLERWLDHTEPGEKELFSREQKRAFAEALAGELWRSGDASVSWSELHRSVRSRLGAELGEVAGDASLESMFLELQGGSFFVREGDDRFRFAHKSFLEFFLARALLLGMAKNAAKVLDTKPITKEVSAFVAQLVRDAGGQRHPGIVGLQRWLVNGRGHPPLQASAVAAANALRLLRDVPRALGEAQGWVPARADLREIEFEREELRGMLLAPVRLDGARLGGTDFQDADLEDATLGESDLGGARFSETRLVGCSLKGARLDGVRAHACALAKADFGGASLRQASVTACDWSRAKGGVQVGPTLVQSEGGLRAPLPRAVPCLRSGHADDVNEVAWSPDGQRLASASDDNSVRVWDASNGTLLLTLHGHENWVNSVDWSPDGRRLASASYDNSVRVWNVNDGRLLFTLNGHERIVMSARWSPNGEWLASVSSDNSVRVWDAAEGKLRFTLSGHERTVWSVGWSPDGAWLASGSSDNSVRVWDANAGTLLSTLRGHENAVMSVVWSPVGRKLASASIDSSVRVWDAESGTLRFNLQGHEKMVRSVAWSPDGRQLASGSSDKSVRVWDAEGGTLRFALSGHETSVRSVQWSPDGRRLASAASGGAIRVWDAEDETLLLTLHAHENGVGSVVWSPDGIRLASGSDDKSVRIWDVARGTLLLTLQGHGRAVNSVGWSSDGRRLASASDDKSVQVWDATDGTLLLTLNGYDDAATSVVWSPDGRRLASASYDKSVRVWDAADGTLLLTLQGHQSAVNSVVWSPDGRRLASASSDKSVRVWDAADGTLLLTLQGHDSAVMSVGWSPDGRRLASASHDKSVRVWDAADGTLLLTLQGHDNWVMSVVWSPDGRRLASASSDKSVRVWDAADGTLLLTLQGHQSAVRSVGWSPDGRRLASASSDGTLALWDASAQAEPLASLKAVGTDSIAALPSGHYHCTPRQPRHAALAVVPTTSTSTARATFYLPFPNLDHPSPDLIRDVLTLKRPPPTTHLFEDLGWGPTEPWDGRVTTHDFQSPTLRTPTPAPPLTAAPPNPFAPGPALPGTSLYGRTREITRLQDATRTYGSVLVLGQRRAGKTSLLNHVHTLSTTDATRRDTFKLTLQSKGATLRTPNDFARALDPSLADDPDPKSALLAKLTAAERPLILLDEVGYLADAESDLLSWLRALGQEHAAIVYFGSRRDWTRVLSRADKVGSSFGNDTRTIELGPFPQEVARQFLVETSPSDAKIPEDPLARWAAERSDGWPFYLQALGYALVESHRAGKPVREQAAFTALYRTTLLREWKTVFESLWDDIPVKAQRLLKELIEQVRANKLATLPLYADLEPNDRAYLEDQGLLDFDRGWLLDRPFRDWLRERSTLRIHDELGEEDV